MKILLMTILAVVAAHAESGRLVIHMLLHAIGDERYEMTSSAEGISLNTTFHYADRGVFDRTVTAALQMKADWSPVRVEITNGSDAYSWHSADESAGAVFPVTGPSPFALQMSLMRYWISHRRPAGVAMTRARPGAPAVRIEEAGKDSIAVDGRRVALDRYTVANLMFGREVLWMDGQGNLAAAMTFAGGLPMEAVRAEYEPALAELFRSGVAQEMRDLEAIGREVPAERTGVFAIVGATLVDGTGAAPVADSVVLVRDGRIVSSGARRKVRIPRGVPTMNATGQTLLPGLWEMHTHSSGVEFGPALLAAGVTTARDCGGEFDYLVAQRDAVEKHAALGPRLLLAGLVDAGGPKAFGHVTAETPEEGRAAVQRYHAAEFQQIKLYTNLTPDVVKAIAAEAHRLGMTVTGHVPQALTTFEGIAAGMDQLNHLTYVFNMVRPHGSDSLEFNSEDLQQAIRFLQDHHTVIDPTIGWGEMSGHSNQVDIASFEPGIRKAPFVLESRFRGMGRDVAPEQRRVATAQALSIIRALHKAGVPIVPGTDTGLVGYGLHRELELYVQAGMTPVEAIQSATIVSARAMNLDQNSGTVEVGKRADMILVNGNPLANIEDLRKVSRVVVNGRMYNTSMLWQSVGFQP